MMNITLDLQSYECSTYCHNCRYCYNKGHCKLCEFIDIDYVKFCSEKEEL